MTDANRSAVRRYLGYADRTQGLYSRLEGAISALTSEGEEAVVCLLKRLEAIEAKQDKLVCQMGVMQVGDVRLDTQIALCGLWTMGNRLARQISTILGVAAIAAPFSSGPRVGISGRS